MKRADDSRTPRTWRVPPAILRGPGETIDRIGVLAALTPGIEGGGFEARAGRMALAEFKQAESCMSRSTGHCMTMGTASTMTSVAETLGLTLPGAASIPAADANHPRMAENSGRRIVDMVWEDLTPDKICTQAAFDNAIKVHMAMGGSTNAIIHVVAMARRAGIPVDMETFDRLSRQIPVLANVRPSGKYLMEDFFYAGGLPALMSQLGDLLGLDDRAGRGHREHAT